MTVKNIGSTGVEFPDSTVQGSAAYTKAQADALIVPIGAVLDFAGTVAPTNFIELPLAASNVLRSAYPELFAVIGTQWGAGDGSTTFGFPFCPANYAAVRANGNVGSQSVGQVIAHTHSWGLNDKAAANGAGSPGFGTSAQGTSSTGGAANLAAGVRFMKCMRVR